MVSDSESQKPDSTISNHSGRPLHELQGDLSDQAVPSTSSSQREEQLGGIHGLETNRETCKENAATHLLSSLPLRPLSPTKHLSDQSMESKNCANLAVHERHHPQESAQQVVEKSTLQKKEAPAMLHYRLNQEIVKEKQLFYNRLYKAIAWKLVAAGGFSPKINYIQILNSCIESLKATLNCFYVPLKDITDLPQNKTSPENMVCELRCKAVYLGTGCGKCKDDAKLVASREALKLFLKKKVIVKICKRKYRGSEMDDLVLLDEDSKPAILAPALRSPQEAFQNMM